MVRAEAGADAQGVDADQRHREPRHARLLQIWRVPARQFRRSRCIARRRLSTGRVGHRPADRISFYTFATLSYTLDVYLRRAKPAKHFLDYAPVRDLLPASGCGADHAADRACAAVRSTRQSDLHQIGFGLSLMILGLFQKVCSRTAFSRRWSRRFTTPAKVFRRMLDAWMATLAFSGQIFCDFAGYSTTAIGVALCLGFAMPDNFRFPYAAIGFSDFWRRWHITLSSWLRDYLYIPLGGNRTARRAPTPPDGHDVARWAVARRSLDLRGLGRTARHLSRRRALAAGALRWLEAGPGGDRGAWAADLPARQHHLGLLPRQDFHRRCDDADVHGRCGGQAGTDDRAAADGLRAGDRRWDRRHALGDARQDAGDRDRAHPVMAGRRRCSAIMAVAVIAEQGKGSAFIYFQF